MPSTWGGYNTTTPAQPSNPPQPGDPGYSAGMNQSIGGLPSAPGEIPSWMKDSSGNLIPGQAIGGVPVTMENISEWMPGYSGATTAQPASIPFSPMQPTSNTYNQPAAPTGPKTYPSLTPYSANQPAQAAAPQQNQPAQNV